MTKYIIVLASILSMSACTTVSDKFASLSKEQHDVYKSNCRQEAISYKLTEKCIDQTDFNDYYQSDKISKLTYLDENLFKNDLYSFYKSKNDPQALLFLVLDKNHQNYKFNRHIEHSYNIIVNDKNEYDLVGGIFNIQTSTLYKDKTKKLSVGVKNFVHNQKTNHEFNFNNLEKEWKILYTDSKHIVYIKMISNINTCPKGYKKHDPACDTYIKLK